MRRLLADTLRIRYAPLARVSGRPLTEGRASRERVEKTQLHSPQNLRLR